MQGIINNSGWKNGNMINYRQLKRGEVVDRIKW